MNRYLEIWKEIKSNNVSILDIGGRKKEFLKNCPFNFKGEYRNFEILEGYDIQKKIKIRKKYDFIIMSHVIEHLENPGIALENVKKLLKNNGRLVVCIPNALSFRHFLNYLLKRKLESYGGYETHFLSFNIETIKNLLERKGFFIEKIKFFDSPIKIGKFSEEIILVCKK